MSRPVSQIDLVHACISFLKSYGVLGDIDTQIAAVALLAKQAGPAELDPALLAACLRLDHAHFLIQTGMHLSSISSDVQHLRRTLLALVVKNQGLQTAVPSPRAVDMAMACTDLGLCVLAGPYNQSVLQGLEDLRFIKELAAELPPELTGAAHRILANSHRILAANENGIHDPEVIELAHQARGVGLRALST